MDETFSAESLDAIVVLPTPTRWLRDIGDVTGADHAPTIRDLLRSFTWRELPTVMRGMLEQEGVSLDPRGFYFPGDDLDDDEEPFEGVQIMDPLDTVYADLDAFNRLMTRFFSAVLEGAIREGHAVCMEPWWPQIVEGARTLKARYG